MKLKMGAFDYLSWEEKSDLLRRRGIAAVTITHQHYVVTLLTLDNFLVERYYNTKTHSVEFVQTAEYGDLEKYLQHISIHEIEQLPG
jgi:hypothetical protein